FLVKRISSFARDSRDLREKRDRSEISFSRVAPVLHVLPVSLPELGPQREIDRLALPLEQQEDRLILGKAGSGSFIGLERAHRLAIDFENNIALSHHPFPRRASGLDPDPHHTMLASFQSVPSGQFLV